MCKHTYIHVYTYIYTPYVCYVNAHFCGLYTKSLRVTELKVYSISVDYILKA